MPTLTNYVAFNGDMSNQHIGFDPHAVMGVVLSNGALISVGSGLSQGFEIVFFSFALRSMVLELIFGCRMSYNFEASENTRVYG